MALTDSLRRLAAGLVDLLHTRLGLLSVELQALVVAAAQALARTALAALLVVVALACGLAALVLATPPEYRVLLLALLALALLGTAAWLGWSAQAHLKRLGRPLAASLDELALDRSTLMPPEGPAP